MVSYFTCGVRANDFAQGMRIVFPTSTVTVTPPLFAGDRWMVAVGAP